MNKQSRGNCIGTDSITRRSFVLSGSLQGVGFRPHVYRIATKYRLSGFVKNSFDGAVIEVQGVEDSIEQFRKNLFTSLPEHARVLDSQEFARPIDDTSDFSIEESCGKAGEAVAHVLPDIAPCSSCLAELRDPSNRRYRHPFISCTNCGPRYSILTGLPFDRERTAMSEFPMCAACFAEYQDPGDRRFHSQTNCCSECGPRIALQAFDRSQIAGGEEALREVVRRLQSGEIIAVKGNGGYLLLADASADCVVDRLRQRKRRPDKPLAVMLPEATSVSLRGQLTDGEQALLFGSIAPILLCHITPSTLGLSRLVCSDVPSVGIMSPSSPLLILIADGFGGPLVATSGNTSGDPICYSDKEAFTLLAGIADAFLTHDREIVRPLDDSVMRSLGSCSQVIRVGRGIAPLMISCGHDVKPTIGAGAQTGSAVAFGASGFITLSQCIGDMESIRTIETFKRSLNDLEHLAGRSAERAICDLHPDYTANGLIEEYGVEIQKVQHHVAHALSCILENEINEPVLAVVWDGAGYGSDHVIWGGEFFLCQQRRIDRVGSFREFSLPGGAAAVRDCRRSAIGILTELESEIGEIGSFYLPMQYSDSEQRIWKQMISRRVNSPRTTSVGRLFDAVVGLIGMCAEQSFEGQAAMLLESLCRKSVCSHGYVVSINQLKKEKKDLLEVDWRLMLLQVIEDIRSCASAEVIATRFHLGLIDAIAQMARQMNVEQVLLTGGCFQNRFLTEQSESVLRNLDFEVYFNYKLPMNDSGIAAGQLLANEYHVCV